MAKNAVGVAAQVIIGHLIHAKLPPHLKKSINQAHLENGSYEQIKIHVEKKLELENGLNGTCPIDYRVTNNAKTLEKALFSHLNLRKI